jgi:uncharacterized protein (DUF2384 family)
MEASEVRRAVDAAGTTAAALGLDVGDAVVVHNSDRIAVRLTPCDVLARVARFSWRVGHLRERDRELVSDTLRRVSTRTRRWAPASNCCTVSHIRRTTSTPTGTTGESRRSTGFEQHSIAMSSAREPGTSRGSRPA